MNGLQGEIVDHIPDTKIWKYNQLTVLEVGQSVLYKWELWNENQGDPWPRMRTVAWAYGRRLGVKFKVFKRKEGIYVSRIE